MLNTIPNASFTEDELKATDKKEEHFEVKKIIGHKKTKVNKYYLVWWKGYKRNESTFEKEDDLINDGLKYMILNYEKELKQTKKKL